MTFRTGVTRRRRDFTTAAVALGAILGGLFGMLLGDPAIIVGAAAGAGAGFMVGAALDSRVPRPPRPDRHGRQARPI